MFPFKEMLNEHDLSFKPLAEMWKLHYELWTDIPETVEGKGPRLIEWKHE